MGDEPKFINYNFVFMETLSINNQKGLLTDHRLDKKTFYKDAISHFLYRAM